MTEASRAQSRKGFAAAMNAFTPFEGFAVFPRADSKTFAPSPLTPTKPPEAPTTDANSSQAIDSLLEKSRNVDALVRCEAVAKEPGDRDLAHFLHQYGLALARNGKPDDAAVMFTRCAAIYPASEDACHCLIQLAIIHRDALKQPDTARRLMELAQARAREHNHAAAAMLAAELLPSVAK